MPHPPHRPAFALRDLCFGLAALALAAAIVLAATTGARKRAQLAAAQNQLRWIAGVTSNYAADFEDRMWGLSWQAGVLPHSDPGLPPTAFSHMEAVAVQAIEILRRRGRSDIRLPSGWYAPALYSHLPLLDYLDRDPPDLSFVSPGDRHRLQWARDPAGFDGGRFLPFQPTPSLDAKRWPYSASFEVPAAMVSEPVSGAGAVIQLGSHLFWSGSSASYHGAAMSSVVFPAQKTILFDTGSWYLGGKPRYYSDLRAQPLVLSADGAARTRATNRANRGWNPAQPTSANPTTYSYSPSLWEPPRDPAGSIYAAHYRFTRGGPAGRDFGGPEVDTGQP